VWKVSEVSPEGEIAFIHLVERILLRNRIGSRAEVQYDSETDVEPPAGFEQAAGSVGVPLTEFRIDAFGRIKKRVDQQAHVGQTEDMPIAVPLPGKPVAIGHAWVDPHDVTVILDGGATRVIKTRQRYELKGVSNGVATIAVDYQILTPVNEPKIEAQLVQRLSSGTIRFDIATGRVIGQQRDVDKRVLGINGAASSMNYQMRFTEELLPTTPAVARRETSEASPRTEQAGPSAASSAPASPPRPAPRPAIDSDAAAQ
jgi:hypothetical protein